MSFVETVLPLAIFIMRVMNYAISTIRTVAITRNRRLLAASLASLEALIFAVVIANIVNDLENIANLLAYCAGAAAGSYVGMVIEGRFINSYTIVNIFTHFRGHETALALREAGFGVTETAGEGKDGAVTTLRSIINKRDVARLALIVQDISPDAFIATEEARSIQRGWINPGRGRSA